MPEVLVVGAGGIGERHLRCFQKIGCEVGIVEPNADRRQLVASRYRCRAFASWAEARTAHSWKIAVIATPAHTHLPLALELLKDKLHLLIEKPLAVVPERLEEISEGGGHLVIRVAYVYRHMPLLTVLKQRLNSGDLGQPLSAQIVCGEDFSVARPDYAKIYYARHETGGGAIQDSLTHFTNAMDWLVGPSEAVQCMSANRRLTDVAVEDTVCCAIRHAAGCLVTYYVSQGQAPREISLTVHCESGTIRADLAASRIGEFPRGAGDWTWTPMGPFERDDFYVRQAQSFLGEIESREEHSCTLREAMHSVKVNRAALASARNGRLIEVL